MNIVKEIRKIKKIAEKIQRMSDPRASRMVFPHPDLCIFMRRDFYRIVGGRHLVKKGQRRGFFVMSFLWLTATVRW